MVFSSVPNFATSNIFVFNKTLALVISDESVFSKKLAFSYICLFCIQYEGSF